MAERLKSISRRIHWSSLLKAGIFALAWYWLPFWLFLFVALYLYFMPWFHVGKLAVPFFALLLLAYLETPGIAFALVFAVVFYAILLIKDLIVIDRRSAHEFLMLVLTFLLLRDFYLRFDGGVGGVALFSTFLMAAALTLLLKNLISAFSRDAGVDPMVRRSALWLSFITLAQVLIMGLFLPVDFISQSLVVFLIAVLFADLLPEYLSAGLTRTKILTTSMTVLSLLVIVLASAHWGL